jgi:hypothetical protein
MKPTFGLCRQAKICYYLNKNADVSSAGMLVSITRLSFARRYELFVGVRAALQVAVGFASYWVLSHVLDPTYVAIIAFAGFVVILFSPAMSDIDIALRKLNAPYLMGLFPDERACAMMLLDSVFLQTLVRNLGTLVAIGGVAILHGGWRAGLLAFLALVISYAAYVAKAYFRVMINSVSGMVSYALEGIVVTAMAFVAFRVTGILIVLSRDGVAADSTDSGGVGGVRSAAVLIQAQASFLIRFAMDWYASPEFVAHVGIVLIALLVLILWLRGSRMGIAGAGGFRSHYVTRVVGQMPSSGFISVVAARLRVSEPRFGHTDLHLIVPIEFWIIMGIDVGVLPMVANPIAVVTVALVETYFVVTAIYRGFASHYVDVFEFGDAARVPRLFRQVGEGIMRHYYQSVDSALGSLSRPVCGALVPLVPLTAWCCARRVSVWWLLPMAVACCLFAVALCVPIRRLCVAPPIDAFRILLRDDSALLKGLNSDGLSTVSGYRLFRAQRMFPVFIAQGAVIFMAIVPPALGVLRGDGWILVLVLCVAVLSGTLWSSSRSEMLR